VVDPSVLSTELGVIRKKRKDWPQGYAIRALVSLGGDALMLDFPGIERAPATTFEPAPWTVPTGRISGAHGDANGELKTSGGALRLSTSTLEAAAALSSRLAQETAED
jgi:hypothetical protein